jgi:hypothetical protein
MTIERYLRLLAGLFVLLSLALGYWVSPTGFSSPHSWGWYTDEPFRDADVNVPADDPALWERTVVQASRCYH